MSLHISLLVYLPPPKENKDINREQIINTHTQLKNNHQNNDKDKIK